jgi:uncharacterized membrane protein YfcA
MDSAAATSLMSIALIAVATIATAALRGAGIPWAGALPFAAGAVAGMACGRALIVRLGGARMQRLLAGTMWIVAAGLAGRALGVC